MTNLFTRTWSNPLTSPKQEIVARLVLSMCGLVTSSMSLFAPTTFTYKMVQAGGPLAAMSSMLLGILSVTLLADAFVNEILPARHTFDWARRCRQPLWMTCGLVQITFAYQVFTANLSVSLGCYLVIFGLGSEMLAFVDAATEKMRREWLERA